MKRSLSLAIPLALVGCGKDEPASASTVSQSDPELAPAAEAEVPAAPSRGTLEFSHRGEAGEAWQASAELDASCELEMITSAARPMLHARMHGDGEAGEFELKLLLEDHADRQGDLVVGESSLEETVGLVLMSYPAREGDEPEMRRSDDDDYHAVVRLHEVDVDEGRLDAEVEIISTGESLACAIDYHR